MDIYFDNKGLIDLVSKKNIGSGSYGFVKQYDLETLIKIYKDHTVAYQPKELPIIFNRQRICELHSSKYYNEPTKQESIELKKKRLEHTKYSNDLILGSSIYEGYAFGVVLKYYKDYVPFISKNFYKLSDQDKGYLLYRMDKVLKDLLDNLIYPYDVKENNILFDPKTLDVKFIDLDDSCTCYSDKKESIGEYYSEARFEETKQRVFNNIKQKV